MPLFVLGLNHDSAPLDFRERVAFPADAVADAAAALCEETGAREAALLSTCNRTELYVRQPHEDIQATTDWLARRRDLERRQLQRYLYVHEDAEAVRHLMRVAAGLDSMVLGEPQILGQVKVSYQHASRAGTLGVILERLFQHAFAVAKQVRTDTEIGTSPVSVAFAAVTMARQIFDDFPKRSAFLVGAGETMELVARHLTEQGIGRMLVANRNPERARRLANRYDGEGMGLGEIPRRLGEADIVVTSTGSALPVLGKGSVERAVRSRRHRPMFMLDLAVPRDIEPEAGELDDVYLYSVDDLRDVIAENMRSRREAAEQAEAIVERQMAEFQAWRRAQDASDAICAFRGRAESYARATRAQALRRLERGEPPEEVVEWLTHTLTRRLIHAPTVGLRTAAASGDPQRIQGAVEALGLEQQRIEYAGEGNDSEQARADGGTPRGDWRTAGGS